MKYNPYHLNIDYESRVYGLDIIRALAILDVALIHGNMLLAKAGMDFMKIKLIDGVEMFFVLSGFLIGSMLINTIEKKGLSFSTVYKFLVRRWFRTLPNYFLILIVNIIIVYFGIIKEDFSQFNYKFFFFIQNFSKPFHGFFWESWSLSIEEWFYLLFPFSILIFGLLAFKRVKISYVVLFVISLFLIVPIMLRASVVNIESYWNNIQMKGIVIYRLDSIAFGLLAAYLNKYHFKSFTRYKNMMLVIGLIGAFILMYIDKHHHFNFFRIFDYSILSFCIFLFLPKLNSITNIKTRFAKVVTHISMISYSMYLINLAVVAEVIYFNIPIQSKFTAIMAYLLFWFVLITLSTLLFKYYEKPMMDLRDIL